MELTTLPDKLSLYPNPSTGNIIVTYNSDNARKIELRIYDINGKILFNEMAMVKKGLNSFHLNLSNFVSGPYFFELNKDGIKCMKKLLIAK